MTIIEAMDFVNTITCEPFRISSLINETGLLEIRIRMPTIRDVNTTKELGKPGQIMERIILKDLVPYTKPYLIEVVLELLIETAIHEIKEFFTINNERILNPHKTIV